MTFRLLGEVLYLWRMSFPSLVPTNCTSFSALVASQIPRGRLPVKMYMNKLNKIQQMFNLIL